MRSLLLSFFLLLLIGTTVHAQVVTYDDFKSVIPLIQQENFKGTFERTKQLLDSTQNDYSDMRGIITYMNILSSAGMVVNDQMSYDSFLTNANSFIGQRVVMSIHPVEDSNKVAFNSLQFITRNGELEGETTTNTKDGAHILCFEYFSYAVPPDPSFFIGKNVRCGGRLQKIEISPTRSKIWIARLEISNAFIRESSPR
jgi:hypothetical protein